MINLCETLAWKSTTSNLGQVQETITSSMFVIAQQDLSLCILVKLSTVVGT